MKPSGPGLLFVGRFLITVSISVLVIGLFIFSVLIFVIVAQRPFPPLILFYVLRSFLIYFNILIIPDFFWLIFALLLPFVLGFCLSVFLFVCVFVFLV